MLIFISQLSYLSWIRGQLFIDPEFINSLSNNELQEVITPKISSRDKNPDMEIQRMFGVINESSYLLKLTGSSSIDDITFVEGKKIRVSHIRTERNRNVVDYYFRNIGNPSLCDVCNVEVKDRYPWVKNLIEVHHILPLASPIQVEQDGTSIKDLVGLCPNCHRATHAYYRSYLREYNINDFESNDHAKEVYGMVKSTYIPI